MIRGTGAGGGGSCNRGRPRTDKRVTHRHHTRSSVGHRRENPVRTRVVSWPPSRSEEDPLSDDAAPPSATVSQPARRQAVIDLLGVLAYGELMAFDRLAADARLAPTLAGRAALARMAAAEMGHFDRLVARLRELGADPEEAMAPFIAPLDAFHEQTAPSIWLEGLVKAYVGDGMAADFYRGIAEVLDEPTRGLVVEALADTGQADFAVREVRAAIRNDPVIAGRLGVRAP